MLGFEPQSQLLPVGCLRFSGCVLVRLPKRLHLARDRFLALSRRNLCRLFLLRPADFSRLQSPLLEVLGGDSPSLAHLLERSLGCVVLEDPGPVVAGCRYAYCLSKLLINAARSPKDKTRRSSIVSNLPQRSSGDVGRALAERSISSHSGLTRLLSPPKQEWAR